MSLANAKLSLAQSGIASHFGCPNAPCVARAIASITVAFKEVSFNDALAYATNGDPTKIDIESAALHEHGHALELGHYGKIVGDPKTAKLQASPRTVMNAILLDVQRTLLGTDNAALCGNFANLK